MYTNMGDHIWKLYHISWSQENKFSFQGEWWHFKSHVVPKNAEFSERAVFTSMISKVLLNWKLGLNGYACYQMPSPGNF